MSAGLDELERIYRSRFSEFLRVTTALTGSLESGREAVQEGFVNAVRSRGSFRGEGTLDGWVWKAVANSALSRQRRDRKAHETPWEDAPESASSSPPLGAEAVFEVRSAVAGLPERQRLVLFLRYYADLDYQAIAAITGVSRGTVAATLHAAHETLRQRLQEVTVQ